MNIVLDLLLIPKYGVVSSLFTTLIFQTFSNAWFWIYTRKIITVKLFSLSKKSAIASVEIGIIFYWSYIINKKLVN